MSAPPVAAMFNGDDVMQDVLREWFRERILDPHIWDVLGELADPQKKEEDRVSLLRPHQEHTVAPLLPVDPESAQGIRARLDASLDELTLYEIAAQMCEPFAQQLVVPAEALEPLTKLTKSLAFRRYLEAYQFAGVRFLVGREPKLLGAATEPLIEAASTHHVDRLTTDKTSLHVHPLPTNKTSLPLSKAPSLKGLEDDVAGLLECIAGSPAERKEEWWALKFLEGFDVCGDLKRSALPGDSTDDHQVQQMELWLRGLLPELGRADMRGVIQGTALSRPGDLEVGARFENVVDGLLIWAEGRAKIYWNLRENDGPLLTLQEALYQKRPERGWNCDTPMAARLALADLYHLSKLLRAEVSPRGEVVYGPVSWLGLIGMRAALEVRMELQSGVRLVEEVLRSVFGLVCELFHNGAELQSAADYKAAVKQDVSKRVNQGAQCWRAVFDEELEAISRQRKLRDYGTPDDVPKQDPACKEWSWRVREGGAPRELIGLCFSGGGIRSATFNLGVLEGLQELDLLRPVDYLSTVSGGGFIGGWLMGNVRRSRYWLGSQAPWKDSIRHLREYSNYLAPTTGLLSMDTWSLGGLWLRNTLLIQLLVLAWVLTAFAGLYLVRKAYAWMVLGVANPLGHRTAQYWTLFGVAVTSEIFIAAFIAVNLLSSKDDAWQWLGGRLSRSNLVAWLRPHASARVLNKVKSWWAGKCGPYFNNTLKWLRGGTKICVFCAWLGCALISTRVLAETRLWTSEYGSGLGDACGTFNSFPAKEFTDYSRIAIQLGPRSWPFVLIFSAAGLFGLALISLWKSDSELPQALRQTRSLWRRVRLACSTAALCTVVLHLLLSVVAYVALRPWLTVPTSSRGTLFGFVFGPAAVVGSYALVVLLLVGLIAKRSNEAQREFWTRYGAWVLVSALLGVVFSGIVLGGPKLVAMIAASSWHKLKWTAIVSWAGTTIGGLLAGKSSKTSDQSKERSLPLEVLAQLGGLLFLSTFLTGSAYLLFLFFQSFSDPGLSISRTITKTSTLLIGITFCVLLAVGVLFSRRFEINLFGLNQLYRNRLVRCYLGATRWVPGMRHPDAFTQFDFSDDLPLADLRKDPARAYKDEFRGPFPVLNCSMNMGGSRDLALHTRHSASFTFTPLHCGADRPTIGYVDTKKYAGGDIGLGMAVAISGAAASPNMGYNTSPLVALLLSMFNVRLGWWIPNPGQSKFETRDLTFSIYYMFLDLLGIANDKRFYLNVSDGGHFENMGLYEMVRRRCKVIILGDGECDEVMQFGGLANAIRLCATDFGARIQIDLASLKLQKDGKSLRHAAVGTIQYANGSIGRLIYLKASMTGDEDATVLQYHASHPTFPHQTTADQFFTEDQFESYRRLGKHVVAQAFRGTSAGEHLLAATEHMANMLSPQSCSIDSFVRQSRQLDELWERLRGMPNDSPGFLEELMGLPGAAAGNVTPAVTAIGLEIFQLMENVYMDLRLDDFWEHPDNRGWAMLFMNWARSTRLREVWRHNHRTFGIPFEYFCGRRLGLDKEARILRLTPLTRD